MVNWYCLTLTNFPCLQLFLVLGGVKKLIIAGKGKFTISCGSGLPFDIHFSLYALEHGRTLAVKAPSEFLMGLKKVILCNLAIVI
jgi:hypothetical protein